MLSFRRAVLGTVALSVALLPLLAAAPASAAPAGQEACPNNRFCLYQNTNYNNGIAIFDGTDRNLINKKYNNGDPAINSASSMVNNTDRPIYLWSGEGGEPCRGSRYIAQPNTTDPTFTDNANNDNVKCVEFK